MAEQPTTPPTTPKPTPASPSTHKAASPQYAFGKGGARTSTINDLAEKKALDEKKRKKAFLREQIIFVVVMLCSIVPFYFAFKATDGKQAYQLFKLGGAMLVGLYPVYLLVRFLISLVLRPKPAK